MPFCMHTVISEIRSPAIGPTMVAPRILSPPLAHEILTKPRVTPSHLQRSTASSGRMYVSYAVPAVSSSFSYSPTCAISGSVYLRRQ